ncbi:MAG: apolipoprotein N-acyltransferase [Sphingopyxis sp.]|nr:apolipoprotein N-acyltransferase [Sphingopyxis sp.]
MKDALSRIARQTIALARTWPRTTALLLGLASATGFAPLGLWPVTLLALALLILQMAEAPTQRRAFTLGWAFGVGHFALGLNWIATAFTYQAAMPAWLGWIAVVLLALYLAVFPGLATWGAWFVARRLNPPRNGEDLLPLTLAFAATWIITEWLRSWVFTGFAWNPLGAVAVSAAASPTIWLGTYGTAALPIVLSGGLLLMIQRHLLVAATLVSGPVLLMATATLWIDHQAFQALVRRDSQGIGPRSNLITIVQPNVGQQDKWVGEKADTNFAKLARLTTPRTDEPRLILWPEAAIPDYLETGYPFVYYDRSPAAARARITDLMNPNDIMLLGALKLELDKTGEVVGARNAVMTIDATGRLGPRYDKAHLVPYGEYLPMRPVLSAIGLSRLAPGDLDFWPGPGPRTIDLGRFGKVGVQVCYEIIFSGQVVDRANRPQFIFNPSNDAWFGSWGPPQHLAQARLRAIEEGLPVIRATPTGISAVIDAQGRVRESLPMGVAGRIDTRLPPPHEPTLFARYGNILPLLFASLLLAFAIASGRARR